MSCCVAGCSEVSQEDVKLFRFPASRTLRKRWIDAISPAVKISFNSMICSKHFHTYDYEEVRGNTRLKRNIIPSLFTAKNSSNKSPPSRDETTKSPRKPLTPDPKEDPKPPSVEEETEEKDDKTTEDMKVDCEMVERFASEMCEVVFGEDNTENNQNASEKDICIPLTDYAPPSPKLDTNKHDIEEILTNYHIKNNPDRQEKLNAENIEDILTNYQIKNNPEVHRNRLTSPVDKLVGSDEGKGQADKGVDKGKEVTDKDGDNAKEINEKVKEKTVEEKDNVESLNEGSRNVGDAPPVFIEISVEPNSNSPDSQDGDCVMLLENVQIELDPSEVMPSDTECIDMADDDDDDDDKKGDPISLLTSSDEDDVIIEEPHIDTVEVSDETDEDDVPLVKLLKKQRNNRLTTNIRRENNKVRWGFEYYCVQCHFRTPDVVEYRRHVSEHTTVIEICQLCGYTTASKMMFLRHKRKHKDDKRFKCHLCNYKARHKVSLAYHMKTHNPSLVSSGYVCDSYSKSDKTAKRSVSDPKMYPCDMCPYETKRRSDLKRHVSRRHKEYLDVDDEEYMPE